jgi:uncharacterized protein YqhQ
LADQTPHMYGGQAVIEGVMIRGRDNFGLAVRREDGSIELHHERLSSIYNGRPRRWPLFRGFLTLVETMLLGIKALQLSANMAAIDRDPDAEEGIPAWVMASTLAISLVFGIGLFFITPLMIAWALNPVLNSALLSEIVEGVIRLVFLLTYITLIGRLKDVKRVFAYHGAEHMTVHALEAGLPLTIENVRKFGTPHARCGTAFLLTVVVVSVVVFAMLLGPSLEWRIASRILLLPVIAAVSYEFLRFSGSHQDAWFGKMIAQPGLWLQKLTTRQPDDDQVEVAIHAMETAIAADAGETIAKLIAPTGSVKANAENGNTGDTV